MDGDVTPGGGRGGDSNPEADGDGGRDDGAGDAAPGEAFAVLGDETRMAILRVLGDAGRPLSFSEAYDRVGVDDSSRFNYHLKRLRGRFVEKTDDGYRLRRAGRRVVEAVRAGAVTDPPDGDGEDDGDGDGDGTRGPVGPDGRAPDPGTDRGAGDAGEGDLSVAADVGPDPDPGPGAAVLDGTRVGHACPYCGAPVEADWRAGSVELYCTDCAGRYGARYTVDRAGESATGYLGRYPLPPAGLRGRTPREAVDAARTWGTLEVAALAEGVCPRCSAPLDRWATVDEGEDRTGGRTGGGDRPEAGDRPGDAGDRPGDAGDGATDADEGPVDVCGGCGGRHDVIVKAACPNCVFEAGGAFVNALLTDTDLLAFLAARGHNPLAPAGTPLAGPLEAYGEEVVSTDPFEARFTVEADGDAIVLTVGEDLTVVDAEVVPGGGADRAADAADAGADD